MNESKAEHQPLERDQFTQFMMGPVNSDADLSRDFDKEPEENTNESKVIHNHQDHFEDWLFGNRQLPVRGGQNTLPNNVNQIINNLDFIELMENIDKLVNSAQQLKPLYSKVSPMIKQIFKNN